MHKGLPFVLIALAGLLAGCPQRAPMGPIEENFSAPLPPGELALRKVNDPRRWPDLEPALSDVHGLDIALSRSLSYLSKPSSRAYFPYGPITHSHAVESLETFASLLDSGDPPAALAGRIRRRFDLYESVGWDGSGEVLFTGYYTPILPASPVPTPRFRYPLYAPPPGLRKNAEGDILGIEGPSGRLRPVPARADLPGSGLLRGNERVWLADPFDVYVAHVQGSARLHMPDGNVITAGYAASNGRDYKSVGLALVEDGRIERDRLSLDAMRRFFRENPDELDRYINRNPRFIFFTLGGGPPRGSLNEPVTGMRSIATDKQVYPRACLAWVVTSLPQYTRQGIAALPYSGFALDQDTGGAIRAPGRCDVYMGEGDDAAALAGRTRNTGRLYYLFLKPRSVQPR